MKKKILYITGTRADYGLMKEVLREIESYTGLQLEIAVCGMHLMPEFGKTLSEIVKDGFKIHKINAVYKKDSKESAALFIGTLINLLSERIKKIKPDIILLLGDRAEMLAGSIVGAYLSIPVAHIHGGDVSSTIDDSARHAITKLSHIHFPATKKSAERIIKMGEEKWRVYVTGAPGLDGILKFEFLRPEEIAKKYGLDLSKPFLLLIQHSVTEEFNKSAKQIEETMSAVKELRIQAVVSYPNADVGGREMIKVIDKYKKYPFIKIYKNIPRRDFLSLMKMAGVMIGNSSSGIIESPSFKIPVVNIGTRQSGRERAGNILKVDYKKEEIKKAIKKALYDQNFLRKVKKIKSPYGDGQAHKKIPKILSNIKINKKLLEKKLTY